GAQVDIGGHRAIAGAAAGVPQPQGFRAGHEESLGTDTGGHGARQHRAARQRAGHSSLGPCVLYLQEILLILDAAAVSKVHSAGNRDHDNRHKHGNRSIDRGQVTPCHGFQFFGIDALDVFKANFSPAARALANDALGEGDVSALLPGLTEIRIQETAFAGVWRVLEIAPTGHVLRDAVEVCALPIAVLERAAASASERPQPVDEPEGLMNARAVLNELVEASTRYRPGEPAHIVNLTLLPMSPADLEFLVASLGAGGATLLSRGYGNCRITASGLAHTWWVQYFNSSDKLILNTIEVVDIPEVALAAAEDIADSTDRLAELLPLI
ncbi:MAG: hydrogenase expression/formation protein, partial [Zoogloea sp.]|nr:hydrogenase expression/formation protein [Zoogloea sp.]